MRYWYIVVKFIVKLIFITATLLRGKQPNFTSTWNVWGFLIISTLDVGLPQNYHVNICVNNCFCIQIVKCGNSLTHENNLAILQQPIILWGYFFKMMWTILRHFWTHFGPFFTLLLHTFFKPALGLIRTKHCKHSCTKKV